MLYEWEEEQGGMSKSVCSQTGHDPDWVVCATLIMDKR